MTPEQEREFIERQVDREISRRHFMSWAAKAGIGSAAAVSLSGAVLQACSSGGGSRTATSGGGSTDTIKVGVIAPFSGIGAFIGTVTNNSLDAALQEINKRGGALGPAWLAHGAARIASRCRTRHLDRCRLPLDRPRHRLGLSAGDAILVAIKSVQGFNGSKVQGSVQGFNG